MNNKNNIYLIGIMGCGKTSIGKMLAKAMRVGFVDGDEWIENNQCKSISQIFEERGEEGFREIETMALEQISKLENIVVATGGGIILRKENIQIMKKTGKIIFVKRDINMIIETINPQTRPLIAKKPQQLFDIYDHREPIYEKNCDIVFENNFMNSRKACDQLLETLCIG